MPRPENAITVTLTCSECESDTPIVFEGLAYVSLRSTPQIRNADYVCAACGKTEHVTITLDRKPHPTRRTPAETTSAPPTP